MKIVEIKTLRGPNYWSGYRKKLIEMRLDLEDYEYKPTDQLTDFRARTAELMPGLQSHGCSYGEDGGFYKRLDEGTWAGHVIEHFALELQTMAGMDVGYGRTRETGAKGVYHVVFAYLEEEAGRYAARAAIRLFELIAEDKPIAEIKTALDADIQKLREIRAEVRFGPSTNSIIEEAQHRDIPHIRLNNQSLVQLGFGINQRRIQATVTDRSNMIAVNLASDKDATKTLLASMGVPVPTGVTLRYEDEIENAVQKVGFPVAVKPLDGNHGRGITVNLTTVEEVRIAFEKAKEHGRWVIIEKSLTGADFRALVINNKLVAVAERRPAHVVGNGKMTIQELIDETNRDERRGIGHEKVLTLIKIDSSVERLIAQKNYKLDSILPAGETLYLTTTANISTGGTAIDRTDEVHPYNVFMLERIAKIIGLDIAGIDIVASDVSTPLTENGGGIIEVNAAPGFRMHLAPSEGIGRNIAEPVVDMLFPPGVPTRIPIFAITGTNGKTTVTRLTAHILKAHGYNVGFTTTEGTYIGNTLSVRGDNTGPASAHLVLKDPTVEVAVLESARGGILRSGLGFDYCDIAIVTNVTADHMGLKGIDTLEEMARVKNVVPRAVHDNGFSVLNADDDLVYGMRRHAGGKVALFSVDENNKRIVRHMKNGGICAVYENGYITILKGGWKIRVEKVLNIPLTFEGRAVFMIQNVLAAALAAYLHGVSIEDLRSALQTFVPSVAQTPGRLNVIDMGKFTVIIDFAHNPAGMEALERFVEKFDNKIKTGVIGATPDRRDEDMVAYGKIAARMLTNVILREDDDLRGRESGESTRIVKAAILAAKPEMPIREIKYAPDAIQYALKHAHKGELLVILADKVQRTIDIVENYREQIKRFTVTPEDVIHSTET